ncbi:MAG TPA: hypothetical protein VIL85_08865 [Thermomicrobiales bacterium]|jgi:hypothetical protein
MTATIKQPRTPKAHDHSYTELTFVGISGRDGEIATYGAQSSHDPQRTNLVSIDRETGAILCDCKHAECHPHGKPECWHAREVRKADYARRTAPLVARWPWEGLLSREKRLLGKVAEGKATDADLVTLDLIGDRIAELTVPIAA